MPLNSYSLYEICHEVCQGTLTEKRILELSKITLRLAVAYLKFRQNQGFMILNNRLPDREMESLALDAISDLFERNAKYQLVRFQNYFSPLLGRITCEKTAMIYLRRLVVSRTQQGLSRIFRERDPESAKLLRNIKLAVIRSNRFCLFEDIRGTLIYSGKPRQQAYPPHRLSDYDVRQLYPEYKPGDSIPVLIDKTWRILSGHIEGPFSIEFHDLMRLIRNYRKNISTILYDFYQESPDDALFKYQVLEIVKRVKSPVDKILLRYQTENKLTAVQTGILQHALDCWMQDLLDEGTQPCRAYFELQDSEIDESSYQIIYRTRFEYLIRTLKKLLQIELADYSE